MNGDVIHLPTRVVYETEPPHPAPGVELREHLTINVRPTTSTICQTNGVLIGAIEQGTIDVAKRVMEENRDPSLVHLLCGPLRITTLQLAASKGEQGIKFAELFLAHGANPNVADKLGRTPLHHAASSGCPEMVNILLEAGASVNSRFEINSLQRGRDGVKSVDEADGILGLFKKKPEMECIDVIVGSKLPVPECWGRTPLHQAVKGGYLSCVQALLKGGANVNAMDEKGLTPLLLAGAGLGVDDPDEDIDNYEEIVKVLVNAGAMVNSQNNDTGTTALYHAAALCSVNAARCLLDAGASITTNNSEESVLHEAAKQGCPLVVQTLLDKGGDLLVNLEDQVGRTPLHCAAYAGARECLSLLIKNGGDMSMTTSTGVSVMDAIFTNIPRPVHYLAEEMDNCIVTNSANLNDRGFKVTMDFSILSPPGTDHQMAVVSSLTSGRNYFQQFHVLQHPLLETFLRLKWQKLRIFFLVLLFVNLCFVFSLSFYVVMLAGQKTGVAVCLARRILIASASAILMHALLQVAMLPKHYLRELETWMSITCAIMSLAVSIHGEYMHVHENHKDCRWGANGQAAEWVMHVTSFAVLLAWAELMLLIGRFPTWGLYALMFYTVLQNVFKVLLVFICLVIGFSFSFAIQFNDLSEFQNPWRAFVKTTVMMMGEYEFNDMFNEKKTVSPSNSSTTQETYVHLEGTSRVIFVLFIVLTSIVLMNLMVGLAVSDIQALEKESHIRIRLKQADFVAHLEKFTSHHVLTGRLVPASLIRFMDRRRCIGTTLTLHPAVQSTWEPKLNTELLEGIVGVAVKNQAKTVTKVESVVTNERKRAYSRIASVAAEEHQSMMSMLLSLQRDITEMRDMMELDRNTSNKISRHKLGNDLSKSNFDLRSRKLSRNPSSVAAPNSTRFSEIVHGLQLRHANLRKIKSNKPGFPV